MRCAGTVCPVEATLELLRAGRRVSMAVLLLERALQAERQKGQQVTPLARRGRRACA